MDRITCVQTYVNRLLDTISDPETHRIAALHLYGVAGFCAFLALKRGLSPELATVAGLLHDIATYANGSAKEHAGRSAGMARSCLRGSGLFTQAEMDAICAAIAHHSAKDQRHDPLDEALKDADVLQHYLYNPAHQPAEKEALRCQQLIEEIRSGKDEPPA